MRAKILMTTLCAAWLIASAAGCRRSQELVSQPPRLERLAHEAAMRQLVADLNNNYPLSDAKIWSILSLFLKEHEKLFGCGYTTVPLLASPKFCATYYVHRGTSDQLLQKHNPEYDFSRRPDSAWYYLALKSSGGIWTEPYETTDHAGNIYRLISYSCPVFVSDNPDVLRFVVSLDIKLEKDDQ